MTNLAEQRVANDGLATIAFSWLESEGDARLLVDEELRVRWANGVAQSWLEARDPIRHSDGRICLGRWTSELSQLLVQAQAEPQGTCVPVSGRGSHLILCARLLGLDGVHYIFGLRLRRTDEALRERPMGVAQAFKLTAAEARVLQTLCCGDTAQQAAKRAGVSVETIRTHIRRLYQKVGVSSREALLTRVRPFMMVI